MTAPVKKLFTKPARRLQFHDATRTEVPVWFVGVLAKLALKD
jgi:hypothetical protein